MTVLVRMAGVLVAAALLAGAAACSPAVTGGDAPTAPAPVTVSSAPAPPYDIRPLLTPARKYLGAALEGVPSSVTPVDEFTAKSGKQPNLLAYYAAWGDQFNANLLTPLWNRGQLPYIAWEPFTRPLAQIADGADDKYLQQFAADVTSYRMPVAISFAHEMNGHWYPWGTKSTTAADYVRAWRHVHEVFLGAGATNVIWVWSPNVVNPLPEIALKPYYPGDGYVDWVGVVGYFAKYGASTFDTLFGPTFDQVRGFSGKPLLIAETGSTPGARKPADIAELWRGVGARKDVIGFIWFNLNKETDWRIESSASAKSAFAAGVANSRY